MYRSVRYAVLWGLVARRIKGFGTVEAIGVDEIQWQKGHRYLTLVYQIDGHCRRLLWVGRDRTEKALHGFFDLHGPHITPTLKWVCSDMWKAYLKVLRERAGDAVHILDRYPRDGDAEQGDRQSSCGRSKTIEGGRLRTGAEAFALVFAQREVQLDEQANGEASRTAGIQPAVREGIPITRRLPAFLVVSQCHVGESLLARVVYSYDAIEA